MSDPYEILREAQQWIASFAGACVGADEMVDRIAECIASRPASASELALKHGFPPWKDPPR